MSGCRTFTVMHYFVICFTCNYVFSFRCCCRLTLLPWIGPDRRSLWCWACSELRRRYSQRRTCREPLSERRCRSTQTLSRRCWGRSTGVCQDEAEKVKLRYVIGMWWSSSLGHYSFVLVMLKVEGSNPSFAIYFLNWQSLDKNESSLRGPNLTK